MRSKKRGFKLASYTFIGFLSLFIITSIIGIMIYGIETTMREIVMYLIGASAFGMALGIVLFVLRKQIWKW